jgi:glycosyltransferase involved in cell wall biosynthesis
LKSVVFILGSYYPHFSAVGNCAYQVIRCLENDYRISVLSVRTALDHLPKEQIGLVDILRVDTGQRTRRLQLAQATGPWGRTRLQWYRMVAALRKLLARETVEKDLVTAYLDALKTQMGPIDVIVPLVFPFESVLAALAYKKHHPDTMVVPYLFDDYVESRSLHVLGINRILKETSHLALERKMLAESDTVLAMHPLRAHFENHFQHGVVHEIMFLEHPLLAPIEIGAHRRSESPIVMCYSGALIRNVREPDYLLDLLQAMPLKCATQVNFFVMGNNAHKVKSRIINDRLRITNHGRVAKERASQAMVQSNVLLNLGELRGKQVSSKVFEYMAAGKPIIHLAFVPHDAVAAILAKYPLALCLVQRRDQLQHNARLCAEFIDRHKHSQLSFAAVADIYPEAMPSTTADLMRSIFSGGVQ